MTPEYWVCWCIASEANATIRVWGDREAAEKDARVGCEHAHAVNRMTKQDLMDSPVDMVCIDTALDWKDVEEIRYARDVRRLRQLTARELTTNTGATTS